MTVTMLIVDSESAEYMRQLATCHDDLKLRGVGTADEALCCCADADVLVALGHHITQALIDAMPGLRWIQVLTTGVDHLATLQLPPGVLITTARGCHGPQMSELALFTMMALLRNLRGMLDNQRRRRWQRWPQPVLVDKTIVIVGVGAIGEGLAIRCAAFGMRVIGVSASRTEAPGFDAIMPQAQIAQAAGLADFLVLLLPYTPRSHHLVDATVLAAMQPHAMLSTLARRWRNTGLLARGSTCSRSNRCRRRVRFGRWTTS
jgi:D-2-hydroxyacid dehydrogenase (NADP+)